MSKEIKEGKLYVGNLCFKTRTKDLQDVFEKYGKVDDVQIILDRYTGKAKGFGFVTFENAKDAKDAMKALNDTELDGRHIRVDKANPQRNDDRYGSGDRHRSSDGQHDRYHGRDRDDVRDRDDHRDRRDYGSSRR